MQTGVQRQGAIPIMEIADARQKIVQGAVLDNTDQWEEKS